MKQPFIWDPYSNQPYPIKDKAYKKRMRLKHFPDSIKLALTNALFFPLSLAAMSLFKGKKIENSVEFYGMGVCVDDGEKQVELINELGVKHLLIRVPLWDMDRLEEYVEFAKSFGDDKSILINILQDREHIEDKQLTITHLREIFSAFNAITNEFQIGNAINRTKWGFFSVDEYLRWFKTVQTLRDRKFSDLKLIGPSVIDFEYHYTIRALFNLYPLKFDKLSALLYVDRRGAPDNKQMGIFDTKRKIDLLYSISKLSHRCGEGIYITETNWPIKDTTPYAPTSERECVDLESYAKYMLQYHQIAKKSGKIDRVYWHRLIAPGYGLVDNRNGKIVKYPAFEAYKKMIENAKIKGE